MEVVLSVFSDLIHIAKILVICRWYLGLKEKQENRFRYLWAMLLTITVSISIFFCKSIFFDLFIYIACVICVMKLCYAEKTGKILVCGLWTILICEIVNMMAMLSLDTANKFYGFCGKACINFFAETVALVMVVFVGWLLLKIEPTGLKKLDVRYLILISAIMMIDVFVLETMVVVSIQEVVLKHKLVYSVAFILVSIGTYIQIAAVLLLIVSKNSHKQKEYIIKQCLEEQIAYYEYLKTRERDTKKFRHDIRSHLYFLNKLKQEGKSEEFDSYFNNIIDCVDNLAGAVDVGNDTVNALLNKAYSDAINRKISMNVKGHFPNRCHIPVYDLCTIFFNLLNNAIEAAENADTKEIWVICKYDAKDILIEIGNYYCNDIRIENDKIHTTKIQKEYHGWGLENVKDSVEKCNGLMDIEMTGDRFIVSISLSNGSV